MKSGASLAVYVTKFVIENDNCKEENKFPAIARNLKDTSIANNNCSRKDYCKKSPKIVPDSTQEEERNKF